MLTIKKNNLEIPVAEISLLNGKEVLVLGDYERDLILRTKGNIKLQVQNKFFDLLNDDTVETVTTNDTILILDNLEGELTPNSLIYSIADNTISYYNGSDIITVGSQQQTVTDISGFLSFNAEQSIINKQILYNNLGYAFNNFSDLRNNPEEYYVNQVIYFESLKQHYLLTDVTKYKFQEGWSPLYLSLFTGGIINGNVSILTKYQKNSFTIYSEEDKNFGEETKGLFIGNPDTLSGLFVKQYSNTVYFDLISEQNIFKFRTREDTSYYDLITITNKKIALGDLPITTVDLNVNLSTLFRKNINFERNITTFNYNPVLKKKETYSAGFALTRQNTYFLETDELLVKNPESNHKTYSTEEGLYGSKSYRVRVIELLYDIDIFVKASLTGRYASQNLNDPVLFNERHFNVSAYDLESETYENITLLFGIGDRNSSNVVMNDITYNYDGSSFTLPVGDYSFDGGSSSYVETIGGTHKLLDSIAVVNLTFHTALGLETDDLLMFVERTRDKEDQYGAFVHILSLQTVDDVTVATCHIYGYNRLYLYKEMHLVKVGNKSKDIACTIIQNNNTYLLNGIRSFNELFTLWYDPTYYENEDSWFVNINPLETKIVSLNGNLNFLDADVDFGSYVAPNEIGSYFNNAFLRSSYGIFNYLELGTELIWDGLVLDFPRLEQAEQDIEDIFLELANLDSALETRATFFPTITTTDVYLNFREGEYVKNQSLVTISMWLNFNVNATGINTITIDNLPFVFNPTNDRKFPVLAYVNNEISKEAFIHPDPTNTITVKNPTGIDFTLAVHEIHLTVSYFI